MSLETGKNTSINRTNVRALVVMANSGSLATMKRVLRSLGFIKISTVTNHVAALDRVKERDFDIVIFDAKSTNMASIDFAGIVIDLNEEAMLIPVSKDPRVDDIFSLLRVGAQGFIVDPYSSETVEACLERAYQSPPLCDAILNAKDRSAAFVSVILHALDRLCVLKHMARKYPNAKADCIEQHDSFRNSVKLARLFCSDGKDKLRDEIIASCMRRANQAATRLGRTRRKLKTKRGDQKPEINT